LNTTLSTLTSYLDNMTVRELKHYKKRLHDLLNLINNSLSSKPERDEKDE